MALAVGILLVAAVLLAVALFAAGLIDGMSRAVPDAPPGLDDGPVTPEGLRAVRLPVTLRGYRMADVDELIERTAAELAAARTAKPAPGPNLEKAPRPSPGPTAAPPTRLEKPRPYPSPGNHEAASYEDVLGNNPADG